MEELNAEGKAFIDKWNRETHGTTKRIPYEHYLQEEVRALLPLPQKRFMQAEMEKRKVSPDCFINVLTNKYSVPARYAGFIVRYRIVFGFRLEIYTEDAKDIIDVWSISRNREITQRKQEHYAGVAAKVNKSIPQIKRDFTQTFTNGSRYLEIAQNTLQQPSFHARKILGLTELYTVEALDKVIRYCIDNGSIGIDDFKKVLKEKYFDIVMAIKTEPEKSPNNVEADGLIRNCSYYENESEVTSL